MTHSRQMRRLPLRFSLLLLSEDTAPPTPTSHENRVCNKETWVHLSGHDYIKK